MSSGFRWSVIAGIPLAVGTVLFILKGINPSFSFTELMDSAEICNQPRYVRLACLCVFSLVLLLIVKTLKEKNEE